jgi:hypothetical protein
MCARAVNPPPRSAQGRVKMRKMLLAIVAIAFLPSGVSVAKTCSGFVENGGMGEHVDREKARTMCSDPAYKAKVHKALDNTRSQGSGK